MRRRALFGIKNADPLYWDYEWDVSKGRIADCGMTITIGKTDQTASGNASMQLTSEGEEMRAPEANTYVKLTNSENPVCDSGVVFVRFAIKTFYNCENGGFRILISNGSYGAQLYVKKNNMYYQKGNKPIKICPMVSNQEYKLACFFNNNGTNEVYLDDVLVLTETGMSTGYCTSNAFFQIHGGTTVLQEVKYKFNINGEGL